MSTPAAGPDRPTHDDVTDLLSRTLHSSPAAAAETTGDGEVPDAGGQAAGHRSPFVKSTGRPPSPPWYGALIVGCQFLMATILLTYTLLDWSWQQNLGWWNYVAVIALIPLLSVGMRMWQPDETL